MLEALIAAAALAAKPDLVDFASRSPGSVIDMRYAGADNFVGERIDGYREARCLLTREAADALALVGRELAAMGLSLRIYDCYRPQRAVDHFIRWSRNADESSKQAHYPNVPKSELFSRGYIAERSGHSRGSTVDLTIDGLDMGSAFDVFDPVSAVDSAAIPVEARANRLLLRLVMQKTGFTGYQKEWWHFTLANEPYKDQYFDAPVE